MGLAYAIMPYDIQYNVIPEVGLITKFISPPVNYIITAGVWDGIIYAVYRRSKRLKPMSSNKDSAMQPLDVYSTAQKIIGPSKLVVKNTVPNETIVAEGGRDFKWSWMIVAIILAWPAAIAYYFTSNKNSISVAIVPKHDGQGSTVNIQAIGRKAKLTAHDLSTRIQ